MHVMKSNLERYHRCKEAVKDPIVLRNFRSGCPFDKIIPSHFCSYLLYSLPSERKCLKNWLPPILAD